MSVENCRARIEALAAQSKKKISPELMDELAKHMEFVNLEDPIAFADSLKEFKELKRIEADAKKAQRYIDLAKATRSFNVALANAPKGDTKALLKNLFNVVTGGGIKPAYGVNRDPLDVHASHQEHLASTWYNAAGDELQVARKGSEDLEIFRTLDDLENGRTPTTKSAIGKKLGEAANATFNTIFDRRKLYNAELEKISDYFMRNIHNPDRMIAEGKKAWVDFMLAEYSQKTFPAGYKPEQMRAAFEKGFDHIISGGGQLARPRGEDAIQRIIRERTFKPNNFESAHKYMQRFGNGTFANSMDTILESAAKDLAMLDKFGSNRYAYFANLEKLALQHASPEEAKVVRSFFKNDMAFALNTVLGQVDASPTMMLPKIMSNARLAVWVTKGMKSGLRSIPDIAHSALISSVWDNNIGKTMVANTVQYAKIFANTAQYKQELTGAIVSAMNSRSELLTQAGITKGFGKMTLAAEKVGEWSLLNKHMNAMRGTMGLDTAVNLARLAEKSFESLHVDSRNELLRYEIDADIWDIYRKHGVVESEIMGHQIKVLSMDSIYTQMPEESVASYIKKNNLWPFPSEPTAQFIEQTKYEIAMRLGVLTANHASRATSTLGTAARAKLFGWSTNDNLAGLLIKQLMQFKSAQLANSINLARGFASTSNKGSAAAKVAATATLASALTWSIGALFDLLAGKEPTDPTNPKEIVNNYMSSGAGWIGLDVMARELFRDNPDMQHVLAGFMGPGIDTYLIKPGQVAFKYAKGDAAGGNQDALRLLYDTLPGAALGFMGQPNYLNLPFVEAAYKYYFVNEQLEFLKHGYLRKQEKQLAKEPGLLNNKRRYLMFNPTESSILGF